MNATILIWAYLSLCNLFDILQGLSLVTLIVFPLLILLAEDSDSSAFTPKNVWSYRYWVLALFLVTSLIGVLLPSKKDVAIIIGASSLYSLSQTEEAKEIPDNALKAVNNFLKTLSENNKEKAK